MSRAHSPVSPSQAPASQPNQSILLWLWRWFWRLALVLSLPVAWYCFYAPSNNIAWVVNATAAQEESAQSGKPVILFFSGKWCVPCRIMKRNVWADDQVTALVNAGFIPVTIDMDDPNEAATVNRYHVKSTPSTIIMDAQGNVLQQKEGGMSKADFLELIGKLDSP